MNQIVCKVAVISIVVISTGLIIWISKNRSTPKLKKNKKKPLKRDLHYLQTSATWENVGKLKNIWIYPIKSCAGISVEEAILEKLGARTGICRDRSLMIVNENGHMITARKVNSTVLVTLEYDFSNNSITLTYPHLQPIKIYLSLIEIEGTIVQSTVWDDDVQGFDCGDEAADWLNLALGCKCRLLYHGSIMSTRTTESLADKYPLMNSDDNSLYADLTGCMLMNEASVADLGKKTSRKLPAQNFRPNLLVKGAAAYDEDNWTYIKIGDVILRNNKPCTRCIFTTIDYITGKRDTNVEPLKTLRKYRMFDDSKDPSFGINLGVDKIGKIKVGDEVYVLRD